MQYTIKGKFVGNYENKTYYTERTPSKHFFILGRGYPISETIIQDLKKRDCEKVVIKEIGKGRIKYYKVAFDRYLEAELFKCDGCDEQRCVPLKDMEVVT